MKRHYLQKTMVGMVVLSIFLMLLLAGCGSEPKESEARSYPKKLLGRWQHESGNPVNWSISGNWKTLEFLSDGTLLCIDEGYKNDVDIRSWKVVDKRLVIADRTACNYKVEKNKLTLTFEGGETATYAKR